MQREPLILLVTGSDPTPLEDTLRQRYTDGYRIIALPEAESIPLLSSYRQQGEQLALLVYEPSGTAGQDAAVLQESHLLYPEARRVVITDYGDPGAVMMSVSNAVVDYYLVKPWEPPEQKLYPVLDELLAAWRVSVDMPFMRVRGIMTVRAVRIRIDDSLHRAAEVIALSGVGDLMVIDHDNNFVGVLSVGDVLRAAMPDVEEIMEEGGTLEQAFRLFLQRGSELMYKPIKPLVITSPLVVDPDDHVAKAAALMLEKNIHRLPVIKDGRLIGTVGRTDVCQAVVGTL